MKEEARKLIDEKCICLKNLIDNKKDITKFPIITSAELTKLINLIGVSNTSDEKNVVKELCMGLKKWIYNNKGISTFVFLNNKNNIVIQYDYKNILGNSPKNTIGDYMPKNIKDVISK